jgi:hypothetical protein
MYFYICNVVAFNKNTGMKSKIFCVGILGVHVESIKMQEEIERDLDSLKKLPEFKVQADSLAEILENWEAALIEIEGFEHVHKHGEHHHHKHSPAPDMTDEQMLEYQQNTKSAIVELRESILKLKLKK